MTVIRHPLAAQVARDAITLHLDDIAHQANELRAAAEEQALTIIETATNERHRLISSAHDEGYAKGFEQGFADGLAQGKEQGAADARAESADTINAACSAWNTAIQAFETERDRVLSNAKLDCVRFAIELAERIVHRTVLVDPAVMEDVLDAAMKHVMQPASIDIRTDLASAVVLGDVVSAMKDRAGSDGAIRLHVDENFAIGSCVVTTPNGTEVDASIRTQLDRLVDVIMPSATEREDGGGERWLTSLKMRAHQSQHAIQFARPALCLRCAV